MNYCHEMYRNLKSFEIEIIEVFENWEGVCHQKSVKGGGNESVSIDGESCFQ